MKTKLVFTLVITGFFLLLLSTLATGGMIGIATSKETLSKSYAGKAYSPYAQRSFPTFPLWGDSHLHTSLSFDAGGFGNRLDPRTAYRLARGEEVISSTGQPLRLARPLDWLAITDHSDGMGFIDDILAA
jgi:hypothetical protein